MSEDMLLDEVQPTDSPSGKTLQDDPAFDEWEALGGRSQDRFRKLAQQKREALEEKIRLEQEVESLRRQTERIPMPPQGQQFRTEEERAAFNTLKEYGMVTREEAQRMLSEELSTLKARQAVDQVHDSLEREIGREKGLPAYDRVEIEDYMRRNEIYSPRAAYRDLYHDEVVAYEASKLKSKQHEEPTTAQTRSRIGSSQPWTKESIQERLNDPDGMKFYEKNREQLLRMQGKL